MNPYDGLAIVLLPFSITLAATTLPTQWRSWRRAREGDEQLYWKLTLFGHGVVSAGLFLSSLWMLVRLLGDPLHFSSWWPSPARLFGWSAWGDDAVLIDVLLALVAGLLPILAASYFGYVDEFGTWCRPHWRRPPAEEPHAGSSEERRR